MVELIDRPSPSPKLGSHIIYAGGTVVTTRGGGLGDLQARVADLPEKFNNLPLDKTVTGLDGSLVEFKSTLKSTDTALNSIDKLIGKP